MQSLISNAVEHQKPVVSVVEKQVKKQANDLPPIPKLKLVKKPAHQEQVPETSMLVEQQLKKDMAEQGVEAPSAITKALIETSDGEEP
jgi:hypothetical protein